MQSKYLFVCISFYLLTINLSNNVARAFFNPFQNDDSSKLFKTFDVFIKQIEQFKSAFENGFRKFYKSNETSTTRKNQNVLNKKLVVTNSTNKFVQNGCRCLNLTCSCCATVEIKKYNLSNTGLIL